ncbi:MAG: metallophosphoesterase family protein [Gaiellaceae bacterium]
MAAFDSAHKGAPPLDHLPYAPNAGARSESARAGSSLVRHGSVTAALVADTHLPRGSRQLSEKCLGALHAADIILHGGDVTTAAALATLEELGRIHAVFGNADEPALRTSLPERLVLNVGRARIGLVHDAGPRLGRHARLLTWFPECDVIAYGHTHAAELERVGDTWVVNPGSPTERRRAAARTMARVVVDDGIAIELLKLP